MCVVLKFCWSPLFFPPENEVSLSTPIYWFFTEIQLKVEIVYICIFAQYFSVGSVYLTKFRVADRNPISLGIWVFYVIHIWYKWRYISIKLENDWFLGGKISRRLACNLSWVVGFTLANAWYWSWRNTVMQSSRYIKGNLLFSSINQKQICFLVRK